MKRIRWLAASICAGMGLAAAAADAPANDMPAFSQNARVLFQGDSIYSGHQLMADEWERMIDRTWHEQ